MEVLIHYDGSIIALYDEVLDLRPLGRPSIERASRVEPDHEGRWTAQLIGGPELGPFDRRSEAIAAEIAWLEVHRLSGG
ncbi:hypothetical protein [Planctomyces sp. SH-PL14]|uniref:hypothetical protein n=1 Tax=Planctomyces sp. SH-PL14 TaxID=1632864 RepID=UPI00078DD483|nr:hypothetical protein [Planctomyces sp. SH-PL14]AMV19211.1 hypothetical protein VT03_15075 [Planctomyces sp. SH-PL14]